jgi:hypothetical protein
VLLYVGLYHVVTLSRLDGRHGVAGQAEPISFPGLGEDEVVQLGWAHTDTERPLTSYTLVEPEKRPGRIRVGVFGGSMVEGLEVAPGHDMPSFLQRDLRRAGLDAEVINFGVRAYGMGQAFLLWDTVGRHYELDYTIVVPFRWHFPRDDTFVFDGETWGPVHARYVLSDSGEPQLIPIPGEDRVDASRRYYEFVPDWRFLRYDARPPTALRPIVGSRRRPGLTNPLYYRETSDEELFELYAGLFAAMARGSQHLIVATEDIDLAERMRRELSSDGATVVQTRLPGGRRSSLYRAPLNHRSAAGNEFSARELSSFLLEEVRPTERVIRLASHAESDGDGVDLPSLAGFGRARLAIGEQVVGALVRRSHREDPPWRLGAAVDLSSEGIQSLLLFPGGAVFVPLPFSLEDAAPVELVLESGGDLRSLVIGHVRSGDGALGQLELERPDDGSIVPSRDGLHVIPWAFFDDLQAERAERTRASGSADGLHCAAGVPGLRRVSAAYGPF